MNKTEKKKQFEFKNEFRRKEFHRNDNFKLEKLECKFLSKSGEFAERKTTKIKLNQKEKKLIRFKATFSSIIYFPQ